MLKLLTKLKVHGLLKLEEDTAKHRIMQLKASCPGGRLPGGKAMCAEGGPNSDETAKSIRVQDLDGVQARFFSWPLATVCLLPGVFLAPL